MIGLDSKTEALATCNARKVVLQVIFGPGLVFLNVGQFAVAGVEPKSPLFQQVTNLPKEVEVLMRLSYPNLLSVSFALWAHSMLPNVRSHRRAPGDLCKARGSCARPRGLRC